MDLVAKEIVFLLCCSLSLGTFGMLTIPFPVNQVVMDRTTGVNVTCRSSTDPHALNWTWIFAGSDTEKIIKDGTSVTDDAFEGFVLPDNRTYSLIIKTASASTAGLYKCKERDRRASALVIVLTNDPSCDYTPKATRLLSCNSNLTLSCTVSYIANTTLVAPILAWSPNGLGKPVETSSTSGNKFITTMTSTLNVTWPMDEGDMPIYKCNITFKILIATNMPLGLISKPPQYNPSIKPFASSNDVQCHWTKRTTLRPSMKNTTDKGAEKAKDNFSVRSAETNNLAIRVLGVAGVLLLAQVL